MYLKSIALYGFLFVMTAVGYWGGYNHGYTQGKTYGWNEAKDHCCVILNEWANHGDWSVLGKWYKTDGRVDIIGSPCDTRQDHQSYWGYYFGDTSDGCVCK